MMPHLEDNLQNKNEPGALMYNVSTFGNSKIPYPFLPIHSLREWAINHTSSVHSDIPASQSAAKTWCSPLEVSYRED